MSTVYPIISTKIRTPRRRQDILRRDRLLDFLHDNIHHKLILISAGAGYGKTALLIDYAHDTDLPVCWYSLDANDARTATFVEYLVAAIRERFPQFGASVLEALSAYAGPAEDVEPFIRLLVNEIEKTIGQYFVLILDDYHEVLDSEPVNALVDGLLRYLPEQCHVILASRGIPRRLTLTRLAARQEVVGLGVADLRFTPEEIHALLRGRSQHELSEEQIRVLAERSEGWITGILLAAQSLWAGVTGDILRLTGASGGVFDYMAEEVLARQPLERQRFLLESALFTEMTPPLCDALLGINNSAQLLRDLAELSLFTFPLDAEGQWYQYHQLFREFLVAKFERDEPQRYRALRLKQAELLAHRGDWARSIESYLAAQAYREAADTVEIVAQETFDSGKWELLASWCDALPVAELERHPRLLLFRAKVHIETGQLVQATELLDRSRAAYLQQQDRVGAGRALVQSAIVQRLQGRPREAIATCNAALELVGERDILTAVQARHNIAINHFMQGQFAEGIEELRTALELAEHNADDINVAYIAHDLGAAETYRGQLLEARRYYHQALLYWRKIGNTGALANTLESLGVVHHHLGQYAEAENRIQEGLAKARDVGNIRIEAYALTSQGDLYRDTGRYPEAIQAYEQALAKASAAQETRLMIYILDALGDTWRFQGDLAKAHQLLLEALDQTHGADMTYEEGLCRLSLGVLAMRQENWDQARQELERARDLFTRSGAWRDLARTALHWAAWAHAQGDEPLLRANLQEVAEWTKKLGTHQFIVAEGPAIAPLLQHAETLGIAGLDYVRLRVELNQLFPGAPKAPAAVREVVPPLEFLALNGEQVLKKGRLVTNWEAAVARAMAFLFVTFPNGLRKERVMDLLWPEQTPERGNSLFHSTMYRLRNALAKDIVLHEKGIYKINPAWPYRYDVTEFRRLSAAARGQGEAAHQARLEAINLYRGPFLETCEYEWCYELRQALQDEMLTLLLAEGQYLAQLKQYSEAETFYLRALSLDSFDERAHRGIMWCRAANNDRAGALRQFRECVRILTDELDVEPSQETRALYEAILAGTLGPVPR